MEFIESVQNGNINISLLENSVQVAKATCFFENTPKLNEKFIGCVGDFESQNENYGIIILKRCEEILKSKNIKYMVAPMNGNTWKKYRAIKYSRGDEAFLLENVNSIQDNEIFKKYGMDEIHTYTSTKGLIKEAYNSESLKIAEENIKENGIKFRNFNKENAYEELRKIYNISKVSFARNVLYTEISEDEFIKQYEPYISKIDEDFIMLAEKDSKEIGFVFCMPNFNELMQGKQLQTLILKTIAVLPEYENMAIGSVLLNKISKKAEEKGFKEWVFAFMHSNNTSQKMAKRNNTEVFREYAIYGKNI